MYLLVFLFTAIFFCSSCSLADQSKDDSKIKLIARTDQSVDGNLRAPAIMGKDFWFLLQNDLSHSGADFLIDNNQPEFAELDKHPLLKESGVLYWNDCIHLPGSNQVSITDMTPKIFLDLIEKRHNAPFFIMPSCVRPIFKIMKDFEHDNDTYKRWKKEHPNFMGFINAEADNDFLTALPWKNSSNWSRIKSSLEEEGDKNVIDTIIREFPEPRNRDEFTSQYLKGLETNRKYFFNDSLKTAYLRASHCFDHYYYESGANSVALETTNTASGENGVHYRHRVSLFFSRGAARQYKKSWMWYIAFYYNGYDDKGNFTGNNCASYRLAEPVKLSPAANMGYRGPAQGMSPSLVSRDLFLAYLSGTSFICAEQWWDYLCIDEKSGKPIWKLSSPYGKVLEEWFEFTRNNPDRGISYAPVALMIPFNQGYPNYGGKSWGTFDYENPDRMIDAALFTIVPYSPVTKKGDEGALSNSSYGDIYDVITPDPPSGPVEQDVLYNYKVAFLLGNYNWSKPLADRFIEYVNNGGTLILNINQLNQFFSHKFLGIEKEKEVDIIKVKSPVIFEKETVNLTDSYNTEKIILKGAIPLLKDAEGNILATHNKFGKGHVIISTVPWMVPSEKLTNNWTTMIYEKEFPFIKYFLNKINDEILPVHVSGDIQYGFNKLPGGWLLYLINNKGVTKFTNKEQQLDNSKTAKVELYLPYKKNYSVKELRSASEIEIKNKQLFSIDVPPGEVKIIRLNVSR